MILNEKTKEKFNYAVNSLSKRSHKLIIVQCDYCQKEFEQQYGVLINARKNNAKDACEKCRIFIKIRFSKKSENLSFKWPDFKNTYHRLNFRGNTGYDKKLRKIWDCGQAKWIKELK